MQPVQRVENIYVAPAPRLKRRDISRYRYVWSAASGSVDRLPQLNLQGLEIDCHVGSLRQLVNTELSVVPVAGFNGSA